MPVLTSAGLRLHRWRACHRPVCPRRTALLTAGPPTRAPAALLPPPLGRGGEHERRQAAPRPLPPRHGHELRHPQAAAPRPRRAVRRRRRSRLSGRQRGVPSGAQRLAPAAPPRLLRIATRGWGRWRRAEPAPALRSDGALPKSHPRGRPTPQSRASSRAGPTSATWSGAKTPSCPSASARWGGREAPARSRHAHSTHATKRAERAPATRRTLPSLTPWLTAAAPSCRASCPGTSTAGSTRLSRTSRAS